MTAIILDIEGTTTSISFVYDVLFPYARAHCQEYLASHWSSASLQTVIRQIRQDAAADHAAGLSVATIPESCTVEDVVKSVHSQMDLDRKNRGLKSLQGSIWVAGYESGEVKGHLFQDVVPALKRWKSAGIPVYIYSSGSVAAQKLLFGHSEAGDLLDLLAGHFDTEIGGKRDAQSYTNIAKALNLDPCEIVFATDNVLEADAAAQAGMEVVVMDRPGNPPTGDHSHRVLVNFDSL